MNRLLTLIATATIATGFSIANSDAQTSTFSGAPPANLHPPVNLDAETLRAQLAPSSLGLKRQSGSSSTGIDLPLGLNYNREASLTASAVGNARATSGSSSMRFEPAIARR